MRLRLRSLTSNATAPLKEAATYRPAPVPGDFKCFSIKAVLRLIAEEPCPEKTSPPARHLRPGGQILGR